MYWSTRGTQFADAWTRMENVEIKTLLPISIVLLAIFLANAGTRVKGVAGRGAHALGADRRPVARSRLARDRGATETPQPIPSARANTFVYARGRGRPAVRIACRLAGRGDRITKTRTHRLRLAATRRGRAGARTAHVRASNVRQTRSRLLGLILDVVAAYACRS